jgi:hypothetical protein
MMGRLLFFWMGDVPYIVTHYPKKSQSFLTFLGKGENAKRYP